MGFPDNIAEIAKGPIGNPDVIKVLEQALVAARAGQMAGVVIIAAQGAEQLNLVCAGGFALTMASGCAQMQRQLLDAAFQPQKRSSLVVPRMHG